MLIRLCTFYVTIELDREPSLVHLYRLGRAHAWQNHETDMADLDDYSMQGLDGIITGFEAHSDRVMENWAKIREGEEDLPGNFEIPRF